MSGQTISGRPLTDHLYAKACQMRVPLNGTFELSPVCNFSCRMCYVRKTQKEVQNSSRKIMTLEDWRRIAREAREAGMLELLLTGGEPLLWPDFWTLYEELIDMGFLVSINTNGSLISEEAVARFRKKPPQRINITLYGAGDSSYRRLCGIDGVYTKVDRAIRDLMDAGITVKLNCSLTPDNAEDIDRIVDYAKERNTVLSVSTYMFPPSAAGSRADRCQRALHTGRIFPIYDALSAQKQGRRTVSGISEEHSGRKDGTPRTGK